MFMNDLSFSKHEPGESNSTHLRMLEVLAGFDWKAKFDEHAAAVSIISPLIKDAQRFRPDIPVPSKYAEMLAGHFTSGVGAAAISSLLGQKPESTS